MFIRGRRLPRLGRWRWLLIPQVGALFFTLALVTAIGGAQDLRARTAAALDPTELSLGQSSIPQPPAGEGNIVNRTAAVQLGKALFWDEQAGSDDRVACATCHFSAGTDTRTTNTINPGFNGLLEVAAPNGVFTPHSFSPAADDIVGSQGVVACTTNNPNALPAEGMEPPFTTPDPAAPRQVTGKNAPPIINAVLNRDNFWNGRARFTFLDPQSGAVVYSANGSLASQAVGPPLNDVEMSCAGRTWAQLGNKLLGRRPLGLQIVDAQDSVLGALSAGTGLTQTYTQLIVAALGNPQALPNGSGSDHDKIRANFSRIWGQAIQAYESTLISDQTPFDSFLAGNRNALTRDEERGFGVFTGKGQCAKCHMNNLLSDATVDVFALRGALNEDGASQGFHNNGVRPSAEDLGRFVAPNLAPFERLEADAGGFKTPVLRNVELTAPYFHTGAFDTIASVVNFYSRGGDFRNPTLAKRIRDINFNQQQATELVAFLGRPLTDERVRTERAPFDHPSLLPPNGAARPAVGANGTASALPPSVPAVYTMMAHGEGSISGADFHFSIGRRDNGMTEGWLIHAPHSGGQYVSVSMATMDGHGGAASIWGRMSTPDGDQAPFNLYLTGGGYRFVVYHDDGSVRFQQDGPLTGGAMHITGP